MRKQAKLGRPSHATVVAYLALFVALGGSAFAATQLAKNSVGTKQLKKNAVTTAKIKNEAVTAAKVKKGTLTGTQINSSTLGTVPSASNANTAGTATTANSLAAPEPLHVVGAPGEPSFMNFWGTAHGSATQSVAFYKDHEGIVHLRGIAAAGEEGEAMFELPPGFRPASGKVNIFLVGCGAPSGECSVHLVGKLAVVGPDFGAESGLVLAPAKSTVVYLEGITFRAES